MSHAIGHHRKVGTALGTLAILFSLICSVVSCNRVEKPAGEKPTAQRMFPSPEDAGRAFFDVAKSGDQNALLAIFGPDAREVLFSGDAVKDKDTLQDFVAAYRQMNRWGAIKAGGEILYIGADNYAFPIPLGQNPSGQWSFDTAAGKDEILARRIGRGELTAVAACSAIAAAQEQYYSQTHDGDTAKQYAQRFVSDEGKQNGLYWHVPNGQAGGPLGQLGDFARMAGYTDAGGKPQPFNGYYFRILTKQGDQAPGGAREYIVNGKMTGGFAILAYPAEYRNSGIMTFVVDKRGLIYQTDLGAKTADIASTMKEFNPGEGWKSWEE
jgi:Protein of unknown function (DUF2950)